MVLLDKENREGQVIYMANMAGKTSAIEKQTTDGSLDLVSKPSKPQVITIEASQPVSAAKLRVAAYVRVSSASEDQLNSFAASAGTTPTLSRKRMPGNWWTSMPMGLLK